MSSGRSNGLFGGCLGLVTPLRLAGRECRAERPVKCTAKMYLLAFPVPSFVQWEGGGGGEEEEDGRGRGSDKKTVTGHVSTSKVTPT